MRRIAAIRAVLLALAAALLGVGCGSSTSAPTTTKPEAGSIAALAREQGPSVALVPGDSDFSPGPVRYSFLVVAKDGRIVDRPTARVFIARRRNEQPFQRAIARREPVGVPGVSEPPFGVRFIYVVHLRVATSGRYWVAALPTGAKVGALGTIDVRPRAFSPAIGALAPRSRTPTLTSTHGNLSSLTTAARPNRALYTTSVAQALAAHSPFVLVFATPKFCESRTCGPVVDVVSSVQKKFEQSDVRFIHVEVYEDNDPSKGYNRWMREWNLQTEPWVFLVGRDGRVKTKFEGSVSADELQRAVAELVSKG